MEETGVGRLTLVVSTKPCFGLPTACQRSLPVFLFLKFSSTPFDLCYNSTYPDSDHIPYVEAGSYVAFDNEKGGVIECLREDGISDLDSEFRTIPEWISMKAMICSWLTDALTYELLIASDKTTAEKIYYSDLPWPIGSILHYKQVQSAKRCLGITNENAERIETEIYRRANLAYEALSTQLGEESFLFGSRPSSLDALFLSHTLILLQALPETSNLKSKLLDHSNLVKYTEKLGAQFIEESSAQTAVPAWSRAPSSDGQASSSTSGAKPKSKPKKERTEEEKKFRRRAKYFLTAQFVSVLVFLSLFGGSDASQMELEDDEGIDYMD